MVGEGALSFTSAGVTSSVDVGSSTGRDRFSDDRCLVGRCTVLQVLAVEGMRLGDATADSCSVSFSESE